MQFRRSAGIFVTGICFAIGGPLLSVIGSTFGAFASFANLTGAPGTANETSNTAGIFIIMMVVGALLSIIGFFLLIASVHRALVKIDALPVGMQSQQNRDNWYSNRR